MSKVHLPASHNTIANAQSYSLVADDLAQTPTLNDKLDLLTEFAINPYAPVPEFHVFVEMEAFFREAFEVSDSELSMLLCSNSTQSKLRQP